MSEFIKSELARMEASLQKLSSKADHLNRAMNQVCQTYDSISDENAKAGIMNKTLPALNSREASTRRLFEKATETTNTYKQSESDYLDQRLSGEELDAEHAILREVRQEIDAFLAPRPKKEKEASKTVDIQTTESSSQTIEIRPARILINRAYERHIEYTRQIRADRVPLQVQKEDFSRAVAEFRTGSKTTPPMIAFLEANDSRDTDRSIELAHTTLQGILALRVVGTDGNINLDEKTSRKSAEEINQLMAMTSPTVVKTALEKLSTVELTLLCDSLSVNMKEKLGNPDMEFCTAEDMALYFKHAIIDRIAPKRAEEIHKYSYSLDETSRGPVVSKEYLHLRDTQFPEDVTNMLSVILDRDAREANFAQAFLEELMNPETPTIKTPARGDRVGIIKWAFRNLVNILEDECMLEEGRNFFSSHPQTREFAQECARRMGDFVEYEKTRRSWNEENFYDDEDFVSSW